MTLKPIDSTVLFRLPMCHCHAEPVYGWEQCRICLAYQGCPKQGQKHIRGNAVQLRHPLQQVPYNGVLKMPCRP